MYDAITSAQCAFTCAGERWPEKPYRGLHLLLSLSTRPTSSREKTDGNGELGQGHELFFAILRQAFRPSFFFCNRRKQFFFLYLTHEEINATMCRRKK